MILPIGKKRLLKNKKQNFITGFTFLELLFVTVIISILISLSLPNFRNTYENIKLRNSAWELYSLFEYLQDKSTIEQKSFRVNIDKTNNAVWVYEQKDGNFTILNEQLARKKDFPKSISIECASDVVDFLPDSNIIGSDIHLQNSLGKEITLHKKVFGYAIEEEKK